ncbi:MAG: hypothetical protein HOV76_32385 [Hamadaea sp.]|nr:hypothetical protein [Catenulispora sp.]NUT08176.1 hypothetical protein [Hamadaea sp.]
MELMRARHEVFGVCDVPATDYYRDNGWTEVDPATPTAAQERIAAENTERRGDAPVVEYAADSFDPGQHTVEEVAAYLTEADDAERERVLTAERDGKARKSLLDQD